MEKAVLKTLIYSDIFDYPLNLSEIHKWLIGPLAGRAERKVTPREIEKVLKILVKKRKIKSEKNYFYLYKSKGIVLKRKRRHKQSEIYKGRVKIIAHMLKIIPWIKLVGISGGLSMENADKKDDIDLILVTSKNRLWLSRLLTLCFLNILGQRRKVDQKDVAGKICCNIILEEDNLEQNRKDLYTAHEVLQMKPFMVRDGIYSKYLTDNDWVFKFLPNWVGLVSSSVHKAPFGQRTSLWVRSAPKSNSGIESGVRLTSPIALVASDFADFLEGLAKNVQLKIMKKPKGMERIEEGALYFHPNDIREKILNEYQRRISRA